MSQDLIGTAPALRQAPLIRQREKVLKSAAKQRSADLLADFENQMGSIYSFDQDEVWAAATEVAEREVAKAQDRIAARCAEKGIPKRFATSLDVHWYSRGENAVKARRVELRKMAVTRIAAIERKAIVEIEKGCLDPQTRIAVAGLTSDAARQFAALSVTEMAGEAEPPAAEQLVSANTLRQRRFRQRQVTLRNAIEA